ncbi:hypothetical protein BREVNS_0278 [Brevinematales bacterium NS]|nr:hypothetical protein BREVNS_0278 [Brevinematales bacterium NS]
MLFITFLRPSHIRAKVSFLLFTKVRESIEKKGNLCSLRLLAMSLFQQNRCFAETR